jgi:hypothetical protein
MMKGEAAITEKTRIKIKIVLLFTKKELNKPI